MAILFLELDDEITSAVARLRQVDDPAAALVLPAGSRIASSRINFRLLAREAAEHGTRLAIVTPDTTARALAIAAGIPAYGAVRDYEAATEGGALPTIPSTGEGGPGSEAPSGPPGRDASGGGPASVPRVEEGAPGRGRGLVILPGRRVAMMVAGVAALALLGAVGAAGVYFVLPEARVTVTPRVETFAPLTFEVTADPDASADDLAAGIVAADWLETSLEASDTFRATGVKVTETKARGTVVFSWYGTQTAESIPAGSIVATKKGTGFETQAAVTVPKATIDPTHVVTPGTVSVGVQALQAGPDGNVSADSITATPRGYSKNLEVTNPQATSGGTHTEAKVVRQSDYDAAVGKLNAGLQDSFAAWLDGEIGRLGETVVQADSAVLDDATFEPGAADVVGKTMDTFDLAAQAGGRVVSFDPVGLDAIGAQRFRERAVPEGFALLDESVAVEHRRIASDDPARPRFEITAGGQGYRQLDPAELKNRILGRPLAEAQAILDAEGAAAIALQPDWFGMIPTLDWRVTVEVVPPTISP